jgi:NAD(P) transhydrogenase subunit alpha
MILGFLKDKSASISPIVPNNVAKLLQVVGEIHVESGIGEGNHFVDDDFEGVLIKSRDQIISDSDILVQITPDLTDDEYKVMKPSGVVIGQYAPFNNEGLSDHLTGLGVTAFSMDMIPRTTLAQSMDVLSSMASIAGYQAVLAALQHMPRYMPMMITAAGSIKPSKVLVIGAGVAGLQAIATARRLGAMVEAFDTRAAVKEEVMSLGAKFVEVEGAQDDKDAGGYAVEQSEDYKKRQAALIQEKAIGSDIVITTAQLRGRPAPKLITKSTVESMKAGSVIVDLAASTGGNCEVCEDNATINHNGVSIIGDSNLANRMPQDASTLYSNNILNFLKHIVNEGAIDLNSDDEILSKSIISKKA